MKRIHFLGGLAAGLLTSVASFADPSITLGADLTGQSESSPKKTTLTFTPTLLGRNLEDEYNNSKWAGAQLDIVGERKVSSWLSARLDLSVLMTTGSFTGQYNDEGKAPSGIILNEALVSVKPLRFFSFDAGVIATTFSALPSMFEASGFPSIREKVQAEGDTAKMTVFAMQSIPTSDTRTVQPTENGLTTSMTTVGVGIGPAENYKGALSLEAGITQFRFNNLNSSAATDSQYMGNTVVAPGPQAKFLYEFGGYEAGLGGKLKITRFITAHASGAYLKNTEAPEEKNKAYLYSGGLEVPVAGVSVDTTLGYFYNESDTLPATYSTIGRGHNNRFGGFALVKVESKEEKISGSLKYTRMNEIEDLPYSADRDVIMFTMEMAYDVL